jgi:hypothetical protein
MIKKLFESKIKQMTNSIFLLVIGMPLLNGLAEVLKEFMKNSNTSNCIKIYSTCAMFQEVLTIIHSLQKH